MSPRTRFRPEDITNSLLWARKILAIAALVQLPLLLSMILNFVLPPKIFVLIFLGGSILSWIGFSIVDRQLSLYSDVLESLPGMLLESRWVRGRLALAFYVLLLAPLVNLLVIAWSYSRAGRGILDVKRLHKELQEKEKQAAKLRGGQAQAFRTD